MKKSALIIAIAALSLASYASAGTFVLDPTSPVLTPPEAFTCPTSPCITAEVLIDPTDQSADLVRISGAATVTPPLDNTVTVEIQGTYTANTDDTLSLAYAFTTDLNSVNPVQYTLSGSVNDAVLGTITFPPFTDTITNGLHQFTGTVAVPAIFPFTSGSFTAELELDFSEPTSPSAASGTLDLSIQQIDLQLAPTAATLPPPSQSLNISTRGDVETGDDVLIGGFIITGTQAKQVIIRALGPSLGLSGVTGMLADPVLTLYDSTGAVVATNDNWKDNSADDQAAIVAAGLDMYNNGTTSSEIADSEAVLVATLTPDPLGYTAIVTGAGDTTGIGLFEVYDTDTTTDGQLGNISTRGLVGATDSDDLIGGFIIGPDTDGASSIIVRALGPSLGPKGVTDFLADPTLTVMDANANVVATNDNFVDSADNATITADGLAPDDPDTEAAVLVIPQAGSYTALVSGVNGTTGVGLVEVYNLAANSGAGQ